MILELTPPPKGHAARAHAVVGHVLTRLEADRSLSDVPTVRLVLDWIQYRSSFREPVAARRLLDSNGESLRGGELAVDLRRADDPSFDAWLARALAQLCRGAPDDAVPLEAWSPLAESVIWRFNRLYWEHLADWESATGTSYEQSLPGGGSDADNPDAIAATVAYFWSLLWELDAKGELPSAVYALEIGVGTGRRAERWLDRFRELDAERGTDYYRRLRFLVGDYALPTLIRARERLQRHWDVVKMVEVDAIDPLRTLAYLRGQLLHVHLTNVYDNLPCDEVARRGDDLYLVEARAYLPEQQARRVAEEHGLEVEELPRAAARLLGDGPGTLGSRERGVALWRSLWEALRLEERLVRLESLRQLRLPEGVDRHHIEELLEAGPPDVRFHLSQGAAQSFVRTLPLLHAHGFLQAQDIFVTRMEEYLDGFRGPGKLDGSVVNWVNGALLEAIAGRAGYEIRFAPFTYRARSKLSILYASQED